jgi:hypothetical protein
MPSSRVRIVHRLSPRQTLPFSGDVAVPWTGFSVATEVRTGTYKPKGTYGVGGGGVD